VVAPGPALRAELVASHDLGADVVGEVAREVVVETAASAGVGAIGPARRGAGPGEHLAGVGVAERSLEALVFTGTEPVPRDGEVLDPQQLVHAVPPALSTFVVLFCPVVGAARPILRRTSKNLMRLRPRAEQRDRGAGPRDEETL
jgi:hypothetical protein